MISSLSILACPKSFAGSAADIQRTALESWRRVEGSIEIVLYGNSPGVAIIAAEHGCAHVPDIATAPSGVPLFSALAEHARLHARHDWHLYLNADIVLPPDLLSCLRQAPAAPCLITGERIDLAKGTTWTHAEDWHAQLRYLWAQKAAGPHGPTGMDYFIFPRGLWDDLKPLPLGRGGYDNALLAHCLRRGFPIVDATEVLPVVHQWHDYSQLPGGMAAVHWGEEAKALQALHEIRHSVPGVADAEIVLGEHGARRLACRGDRLRAFEITLRYRRGLTLPANMVRLVWRLLGRGTGTAANSGWARPV